MTAGVCEVEIENGKVFSRDSSFETVGGSDEVIGGGGRMVECSAVGTNCIVLGSAIAKDGEVEGINEEVNSKKSSTVNQLVRLKNGVVSEESVNILDVIHDKIGQVVTRTCEVETLYGLKDSGDVGDTVEDSGDKVVKTAKDSCDVAEIVEDLGDVINTTEDSGDVAETVEESMGDVAETVEQSMGDVAKTVEQSTGDVAEPVEGSTGDDVAEPVEGSKGDVAEPVEGSTGDVAEGSTGDDVAEPVEGSTGDVAEPVGGSTGDDVAETVEESGLTHDPIESEDVSDPIENEYIELIVVDDEARLSDIFGVDAKSEEEVKGNPEFITEDTEFVESDVKSEDQNKENIQKTCNQDDDAAQLTNEVEQPSEIVDDNKESQMLVMKNVEDTPNPDDDITQFVKMVEHEQETEASNYPITYHTTISEFEIDFPDVSDEKQTEEFEVKEAPIVPILIFPDTLMSPDIKIQFGSFGCHKKDNNLEIVLDDLQGNISVEKVVKDVDDMVPMFNVEASSDFINTEIVEDTDGKIQMEDMIHCEPLCLKDENQFICESESYVSNMGIHDEIQHALNQKQEIEEHLKDSKNEMNSLEDNVSKPEMAGLEIRKIHEENEKEKEVRSPFQAADETKSISLFSTVEQVKKKTKHTHTDYQTVGKVAGRFNRMIKTSEPVKLIVRDSMFACLNEISEDDDEEKEKEKTVVGFDKKSDKLRKEETQRKLKKQIRLEKVREKRLRKKEKKKTGGDNCSSMNKEIETEETKPKPHSSKQLKLKIIFALAFILILMFLATI